MECGDTILIVTPTLADAHQNHLYVVISDPNQNPDEIVIVNFTSWAPNKDQSCVIEAGAHPFIVRRTCVAYRYARIESLATLEQIQSLTIGRSYGPVSDTLLAQIVQGAYDSPRFPLRMIQILDDQISS